MKATVEQVSQRHLANIDRASQGRIADSYLKLSFSKEGDCNLNTVGEKGTQAGILDNFQKIMDSEAGQHVTLSENYGPYVNEVWPVVTAWYPDFPLKDLISVQDMDKPLAYLFFSELLVGRDKAPSIYGDKVETPLGTRTINGKYPTGEIVGESIPGAQLEYDNVAKTTSALLAFAPLNVNADYLDKFKITVTTLTPSTIVLYPYAVVGKTIQLGTKSGGVVTLVPGTELDVSTGLFTYKENGGATATTVDTIVANYVWNLDYSTVDTMPVVKENISRIIMEAIPRALGFEWTLFAEFLKKSQFGEDVRIENTKRILNLLYQFQVRYILDELYDYAEGAPESIVIPGGTSLSVEVKSQQVQQGLKGIANIIELACGRVEGNRIVCGKNLKTFLESLPNTLFQPLKAVDGFSTAREIGKYGTFTVYYDPNRGADEAFMTYRGSEWYDAVYYLGVFMPIVPTDAVTLGVRVKSAFVSMEAYKYHKKNCVIPLTITLGA